MFGFWMEKMVPLLFLGLMSKVIVNSIPTENSSPKKINICEISNLKQICKVKWIVGYPIGKLNGVLPLFTIIFTHLNLCPLGLEVKIRRIQYQQL